MPVIGQWNGANILVMPSSPAPRQIQFSTNNIVAQPTNPFTGQGQQVVAWPGGDYWTGQIDLPPLAPANNGQPSQIAVWQAFVAECRGKLNVFYLGDSSYSGPQGTANGAPVVNGAQSPMAYTLNTRGWAANSFRLLMAGDYLQLGVHLYRVTENVNSDSNGDATISLWPSLRDALTDGQSVILANPQGLFRLAENSQSMTVDVTHYGALGTLKVVEAR